MKAMILAAGLGTRLKPFTDSHPKALAEVNGKTLLQRNIEYLATYGIKDIIINVHHYAEQITQLLYEQNGFGTNISISDETAELLETGGGLKKAAWFFKDSKDSFVLMNVDVLTDMNLGEMISLQKSRQALATLAVSNRRTSRYFLFDETNRLCGWENVETGQQKAIRDAENISQKAFSGIHVLSYKLFSLMKMEGKFSLVDAYLQLADAHQITYYDHGGSRFIDVGKPGSVEEAERMFG